MKIPFKALNCFLIIYAATGLNMSLSWPYWTYWFQQIIIMLILLFEKSVAEDLRERVYSCYRGKHMGPYPHYTYLFTWIQLDYNVNRKNTIALPKLRCQVVTNNWPVQLSTEVAPFTSVVQPHGQRIHESWRKSFIISGR